VTFRFVSALAEFRHPPEGAVHLGEAGQSLLRISERLGEEALEIGGQDERAALAQDAETRPQRRNALLNLALDRLDPAAESLRGADLER